MTRFALGFALAIIVVSPTFAVIPPIPRLPASEWEQLLKPDVPPAETPTDPEKTIERITQTAKAVGDRLKDQDTGSDTRKKQDQLLKDIDALLKQNSPPPQGGGGGGSSSNNPMGGTSDPMPMGGTSNPMPMGGTSQKPSTSGSRPRAERSPREQPAGEKPMPMTGGTGEKPMPMTGGSGEKPMPGGPGGKEGGGKSPPALPLDDPLTKQVWGHLPEKLRQQVSRYYREQYMPRYSELLRQYYSESDKPAKK